MARVRAGVDEGKLRGVAHTSPVLSRMLHENAQEITNKAKMVFAARQRISNEWRTSETTPPKYMSEFHITKVNKAQGSYVWKVSNDDPAAAWVEYGAHAGGHTLVLRYFPLKTALIAQGLTN